MLTKLLNIADINDLVVSERMRVYEASFIFEVSKPLEYNFFSGLIELIPSRDKIKIVLQDENENICSLSNLSTDEEKYNNFIKNALQDEIISTKIEINKSVDNNHFSIYYFAEFVKDLLSLSVENVMIAFSDLLKESQEYLIFDVFDDIPMFTTKTMFFISKGNDIIIPEFDRSIRIKKCREVSYFYNFDKYEVLPDDFNIEIDFKNNPITDLFQRISTLLSISFIASSATINNNQIKGIINGQRTMEYSCEINDLPYNRILYRIYNWIYTDGNVVDKAIIARNVVSLHCKYVHIKELDEKVMASIQSNYNLYLKDNVTQYLELKNKVAQFICEIVSKTGEYATGLLDKFKSNLIAIFGFMFTVILADIVSSQPLDNLFTREITVLVEFVLFGSLIYLIICFFQSRFEINKVYESYGQLKENYVSILTDDDLAEVFGNDDIIKNLKKTINKSEKFYLGIWIVFLIATFVVIEIISTNPSYHIFLKFIKRYIICK